jgi:hypothetical protein
MKKYIASFYGFSPDTGTHEISVYMNNYTGGYSIYYDNSFWTTINSLFEFKDEIKLIEKSYDIKINFFGW